jgi:hypothetical protein
VQALFVVVFLHWFGAQKHDETYRCIFGRRQMQVLHVREHLCVAVAARILGTKKRNVKKERLNTPLLEIIVFYFSVGLQRFFFAS